MNISIEFLDFYFHITGSDLVAGISLISLFCMWLLVEDKKIRYSMNK